MMFHQTDVNRFAQLGISRFNLHSGRCSQQKSNEKLPVLPIS